jgi:hypothetical protein
VLFLPPLTTTAFSEARTLNKPSHVVSIVSIGLFLLGQYAGRAQQFKMLLGVFIASYLASSQYWLRPDPGGRRRQSDLALTSIPTNRHWLTQAVVVRKQRPAPTPTPACGRAMHTKLLSRY